MGGALALNSEFWRAKRVLVTGHTGFKGAWLTFVLAQLGAKVVGLALGPPTEPSLFRLAQLEALSDDRRGDVRDAEAVRQLLAQTRPDVVFHLAAQSLVRASYVDPVETLSTNVMGTAILLSALRQRTSVRAVVVVTSDKCYENAETGGPFSEGDALGGADPYSASKACAEHVAAAFRSSYLDSTGVHCATARAGNVIGGGDFARDRLLPDLMRAFSAGAPAELRNPTATRPFQHVLDPLAGYLTLAERLFRSPEGLSKAYNFGPSSEDKRSVRQVAERAAAAWGDGACLQLSTDPHPHEARLLALDSGRARRELGVRSALGADEAIVRTVEFHKRLRAGAAALDLMHADFSTFARRHAEL